MRRCKDCKYWKQDRDTLDFYNENFGECTHKKVINLDCIEKDNNDKENKIFNNYDIIYSADCFEFAELKVNKEFGCINFEEK